MKIGRHLTQLLHRYGVDCVFGIPGVHTLELYRGLSECDIRHITPRHEQAAGFMADGFARTRGKPGVCFIISGPGMTNILTAMGQAYADSIPMLVISSVNAHGRMGSGDGWLHELPNQQSLTSGVCAFSHTIHSPDELPQVIARAFSVFNSSRPRPVHIEIPVNLLAGSSVSARSQAAAVGQTFRPTGEASQLAQAATLINAAKCPLIMAGGGTVHAASQVQSVAERIDAAVVMTVNARGVLPAGHPLAVGASASLRCVRNLIEEADVVLAIGTELGSTDHDFNEDGEFHLPGTVIRIDIDVQQIVRTRIPELAIVGDSARTLCELLPLLTPADNRVGVIGASRCRAEVQTELSARYRQYISVLDTIRDSLDNSIIVGDSTQIIYAGNCGFSANEPASYFNSATGFGTLGYGLPAAIGAAIANPKRPVVAVVGDGGLQFSLAELASASEAAVNLTLIVHQNGGYAEIKQYMSARCVPALGVDIDMPELTGMLASFGWRSCELSDLKELAAALPNTGQASGCMAILIDDSLFDD